MFNYLHVSFSFDSTSNDNNLMWLTNGYDIFVNYHYSDELFIDFSSIIKNVFQFTKMFPPRCIPTCLVFFFTLTFL
jgi:hypothetical protein